MVEVAAAIRKGNADPFSVMQRCLSRQQETSGLNSFVTVLRHAAEKEAAVAGRHRVMKGPLHGIPIAVKDNFCTAGVRTTASSRMLANFVPPYSATAVSRLEASGAIVVGKTNMDEFGMGSATLFSHFGKTINPWSQAAEEGDKPRLAAGGSSGGSAVAVATGSALAALGSDTGGSVRQPAAFCGLVGLKPTYGRVSRHGLIAYASSLDCPGVLTRTVADAALVLDVVAGRDPLDSTCLEQPHRPCFDRTMEAAASSRAAGLAVSLRGLKVGIPAEFAIQELEGSAVTAWEEGARLLRDAGADVLPVSVPSIPLALPTYFVIACAEASSNLARYDGIRFGYRASRSLRASRSKEGIGSANTEEDDQRALHDFITASRSQGFGDEVQRRVISGCRVLSAQAYATYYEKALAARLRLRREMNTALSHVDVLLTPVTPTGPFPLTTPAEPAALMVNDVMTVPASLAGLPAIAVPVDLAPSSFVPGLPVPVGLQLIGRHLCEQQLLIVARALEVRCNFSERIPDYVVKATFT
jgi:aspartyl-tRNA(Asn)/glutamyl-tRNA(Gln) amidotransferase subunit A